MTAVLTRRNCSRTAYNHRINNGALLLLLLMRVMFYCLIHNHRNNTVLAYHSQVIDDDLIAHDELTHGRDRNACVYVPARTHARERVSDR